MSYDPALRRSVVNQLLAVRVEKGGVPRWLVKEICEEIGAAYSTVRRWVREELDRIDPQDRRRTTHIEELKPHHIEVIVDFHGDLAKAKRALDPVYPEIAAMSLSTFRRRWEAVDGQIRGMATEGAKGAMRSQLRCLYEADHRNQIWHLDGFECPVWVLPAGNTSTVVKPWIVTVLDDRTRRLMATHVVMARPSADDAVAALADAMRFQTLSNGEEVGGVPVSIHTDNGAEFDNKLVKQGARRLGVAVTRTLPHHSHQNGKVEKVQGTLQDFAMKRAPGYSRGPERLNRTQPFADDTGYLTETQFRVYVEEAKQQYNERPHSSLDNKTPNEVWAEETEPLRAVDPEAVRLSLLREDRTYKVQPVGVFHRGRYYTSPELGRRGLVGRKVSVRYLPRDDSFIEIFVGDEWICTAVENRNLPPETRAEIQRINNTKFREAKAFQERAAERRRLAAAKDPNSLLDGGSAQVDLEETLLGDADEYLRLVERAEDQSMGEEEK